MKCLYKIFQRNSDNWRIEFSSDMKVRIIYGSDAILASEDAKFLRRLRQKHESRKKRECRRRHLTWTRKSEESSDYSTSKEIHKLFRNLDASLTEKKADFQASERDYKPLTDVVKDCEEAEYMKYHDSEEDEENDRPYNSQQARVHDKLFPELVENNQHSDEDDDIDSGNICRNYKKVKRFKRSLRSMKRKAGMTTEFKELKKLQQEKKHYGKHRSKQARMKESKNRFARQSSESEDENKDGTIRLDFLTLAEVLREKDLPPDTVICCSLCRLLVSNNLREEFFIFPCACSEKVIHTKCAIENQYEIIRQKCLDCGKYNTDRIVSQSRLSRNSNSGETQSHSMNLSTAKKTRNQLNQPSVQRRLQAHFEYKCYICYDRREIREDRFEQVDSKLVKPCSCNVTAHNECLVKSLMDRRTCGYCNQRIKIKLNGPKLGFCGSRAGVFLGILTALLVFVGFFLAYYLINYTTFHNETTNIIVKNTSVAAVTIVTISLLIYIIRGWKRVAGSTDNNASVVIIPFQPRHKLKRGVIKGTKGNKTIKWEEVPFDEMERRYPGRAIQKFLRNGDAEIRLA